MRRYAPAIGRPAERQQHSRRASACRAASEATWRKRRGSAIRAASAGVCPPARSSGRRKRFVSSRTEQRWNSVERLLQRVHPDDAALVQQTIERAARDGKDFEHRYRLIVPDGSIKHVHVMARAFIDELRGLEFIGAVMDVTERTQGEALLAGEKRLLEMIARNESRTFILDALCRLVEDSPAVLGRRSCCSIPAPAASAMAQRRACRPATSKPSMASSSARPWVRAGRRRIAASR